jgi:large subunit ribosomal protein L13
VKSFLAKKDTVEAAWHLIDAEGLILGRMAAEIAPILMGKTKPTYTPHIDTGDFVIVVNAEKIKVSGDKAKTKTYQSYSRHPGGQKIVPFEDMLARQPQKVIELAVRRMLPKGTLGRQMLKKLKVFKGPDHPHTAQNPQKLEL